MYEQDLSSVFLNPVQTDATLLANNSKHCWIKNVTYCVRLHTLLRDCCCVLLGVVGQSLKPPVKPFSPVQRDATLLGDVASVITYSCSSWGLLPYGLLSRSIHIY